MFNPRTFWQKLGPNPRSNVALDAELTAIEQAIAGVPVVELPIEQSDVTGLVDALIEIDSEVSNLSNNLDNAQLGIIVLQESKADFIRLTRNPSNFDVASSYEITGDLFTDAGQTSPISTPIVLVNDGLDSWANGADYLIKSGSNWLLVLSGNSWQSVEDFETLPQICSWASQGENNGSPGLTFTAEVDKTPGEFALVNDGVSLPTAWQNLGTDADPNWKQMPIGDYVNQLAAALSAHINSLSNPHLTTKAQVGLGNVENAAASALYIPKIPSSVANRMVRTVAGGNVGLTGITIDDSNNVSGVANLTVSGTAQVNGIVGIGGAPQIGNALKVTGQTYLLGTVFMHNDTNLTWSGFCDINRNPSTGVLQVNTGTNAGASFVVQGRSSDTTPLVSRGTSGQSGNLFECQNNSGTAVALVNHQGDCGVRTLVASSEIISGYYLQGPEFVTNNGGRLVFRDMHNSNRSILRLNADQTALELTDQWTGARGDFSLRNLTTSGRIKLGPANHELWSNDANNVYLTSNHRVVILSTGGPKEVFIGTDSQYQRLCFAPDSNGDMSSIAFGRGQGGRVVAIGIDTEVGNPTSTLLLRSNDAAPWVSSNIVGGQVIISGGAGTSASTGNAHGGSVSLRGGQGYGTGIDGAVNLLGSSIRCRNRTNGSDAPLSCSNLTTSGNIVQSPGSYLQTGQINSIYGYLTLSGSFVRIDGNLDVWPGRFSNAGGDALRLQHGFNANTVRLLLGQDSSLLSDDGISTLQVYGPIRTTGNITASGAVYTPILHNQDTLRINQPNGTRAFSFGTFPGVSSYAGFWAGSDTPDSFNYCFLSNGISETIFNGPFSGSLVFRLGHVIQPLVITPGLAAINGNLTASGTVTSAYQTSSSDPSSSDIPAGSMRAWLNTSSNLLFLAANVGGTIRKAAFT